MGRIGLQPLVQQLRLELADALVAATEEKLQFEVTNIDLELQVVVTTEGEGKTKFKLWVLDIEAGGSVGRETVQTVTLSLKPMVEDATGEVGPTKLSGPRRS